MAFALMGVVAFAQTVTLTFTGQDAANQYVQLDRVSITNQTKDWQETLVWPDTVLTMQNGTGIGESVANGVFGLSQNNPNPFSGTTNVNLTVAFAGAVTLEITDGNGKIVETCTASLQPGTNQFRVSLSAAGTYILTARQNGKTSSVKMVCNGAGNGSGIEYIGTAVETPYYDVSTAAPKSHIRGFTDNPFTFGDQMEYVGYATINGLEVESRHIVQAQEASQTFVLQFDATPNQLPTVTTAGITDISSISATCGGEVTNDGGDAVTARGVCWGISQNPTVEDSLTTDGAGSGSFISRLIGLTPNTTYYVRAYAINSVGTAYGEEVSFTTSTGLPCTGTPTLTDIDGNVYNTVQIGNQCWMKENLRTTRYADSIEIPSGETYSYTDPYRYAPDNDEAYVAAYGYLYNWPAVMHGAASSSSNPSRVQGICPDGWHVPSDAEWEQLKDYLSCNLQYGCLSNLNIAKALASTTGWTEYDWECAVGNDQSTNNATGFSALPAGYYYDGFCTDLSMSAYFWSATIFDGDYPSVRYFSYYDEAMNWSYYGKDNGFSIRCLRDEAVPTVTTAAVTDIGSATAVCGGDVTSDGGTAVTARGISWGTVPGSTIGGGANTEGTGTGSFTSTLTGLMPNTTYYVRAYATNSAGTAYGEEVRFTTTPGQPCAGTPALTDIDGNVYNTVQIGSQCWMKENLRTTRYADSTEIPASSEYSTTSPYRYAPNNNGTDMTAYGYLYNWPAVMRGAGTSESNPSGVQGICPTGWHVPSSAEWAQLIDYVSSQGVYKCGGVYNYIAKALAAATGWEETDYSCCVGYEQGSTNNATGFSVLPAGLWYEESYNSGRYAYFWSTTSDNDPYTPYVWCYIFSYGDQQVEVSENNSGAGFSVRCIRD